MTYELVMNLEVRYVPYLRIIIAWDSSTIAMRRAIYFRNRRTHGISFHEYENVRGDIDMISSHAVMRNRLLSH